MKIKLVNAIGFMVIVNPIYANVPSFVGDLIARDLSGAGPAGHVGIASAPHYKMRPTAVLEAMNTVPHIQENTIENFKSRSNYWGSKGGLISPQSNESFTVANRIVRQYYACPEYSYTWRWREGKIDSKSRPTLCAIFRCDTLVNYSYAFDSRYSLPTYNTVWTSPLAIYNYFPVDSDLLLPEKHIDHSVTQNVTNENIDSINKNNLKDLNGESFYQIMQNSPGISKEQIIRLWKLFTQNEVNNNVKILFFDFIAFENPDYLTKEIIQQTKKENGELRHKLLVILQSIYQNNLGHNDQNNLNEIVEYFKEIQNKNLNKDDAGIVYRGLATLTANPPKTKNINLTNMDKIHVDILSLAKDKPHEILYVDNIINSLEHPDDRLVITATYKYLTELLLDNLNFFSPESKDLFKKHLDKKRVINTNESMIYTSSYIEFKAALNARKLKEIPILVNDYMQLLDPDIRESTVYGFTEFTKKGLNDKK